MRHAGAEDGHDRECEQQHREREHDVDHAHEHRVQPAAAIAGDHPDGHADHDANTTLTTATCIEAWMATSTRDSTSRPSSSVPNQCAPLGAAARWHVDVVDAVRAQSTARRRR